MLAIIEINKATTSGNLDVFYLSRHVALMLCALIYLSVGVFSLAVGHGFDTNADLDLVLIHILFVLQITRRSRFITTRCTIVFANWAVLLVDSDQDHHPDCSRKTLPTSIGCSKLKTLELKIISAIFLPFFRFYNKK